MILRAIEDRMHTSRNEGVALTRPLSVEHLLPQNGTLADYPFAATMPLETGETPDRLPGSPNLHDWKSHFAYTRA
jgi:hypothetical protein